MYKRKFIIGSQSGDHRRYPASVCRRFFDKMSSTDRLAIVGRSTADDRATFGLYYDERISKKVGRLSADHRATIAGRCTDDKTPENRRIGQQKLLTWVLRQKKVVGRPKISAKIGADGRPTIGRRRPISHFGSPTVGRPSVWVMWL